MDISSVDNHNNIWEQKTWFVKLTWPCAPVSPWNSKSIVGIVVLIYAAMLSSVTLLVGLFLTLISLINNKSPPCGLVNSGYV